MWAGCVLLSVLRVAWKEGVCDTVGVWSSIIRQLWSGHFDTCVSAELLSGNSVAQSTQNCAFVNFCMHTNTHFPVQSSCKNSLVRARTHCLRIITRHMLSFSHRKRGPTHSVVPLSTWPQKSSEERPATARCEQVLLIMSAYLFCLSFLFSCFLSFSFVHLFIPFFTPSFLPSSILPSVTSFLPSFL